MSKADLLRLRDIRDAYRLIGECRDLAAEPALWHHRMVEGLIDLLGATAVSGGEGRWVRPDGLIQPISAFDAGLDARGREMHMAYHRELGPNGDPFFRALRYSTGRLVTRTRRQLVPDTVWYRSVAWNEYRRPANVDDHITSVYQVTDDGAINVVAAHRAPGEREFSPRELRLMAFFHAELGRLVGRSLVSATEPTLDKLSPRLRQTLACLLEGDAEREVAGRLGLSPQTVHQYVKALYRWFGVQSRAQLLAYCIKRRGRGLSRFLV